MLFRSILSINSLFGAVSGLSVSLFISIGKPKISAYLNFARMFLLVLLIVPAAQLYGIVGVAALLTLIGIIISPINLSILVRYLSINKKQLTTVLFPSLMSSIIMAVSTLVVKIYIKSLFPILTSFSWLYLLSLVVFAVIVYFISLYVLTKGRLKEDILRLTTN